MSVDLSIVIPVFNEAENLAPLHAELTSILCALRQTYEILYIDDGSTDGSLELLTALRAADPHIAIVRFARNCGQTAALAAGFDRVTGAVIITLDADGQNDPSDIPALLRQLDKGYDVVTGWRHPRRDAWLTRDLPSRTANVLVSWITGVRLHDCGCTLKAMRCEVVAGLQLSHGMHRYIPALAANAGARVIEIVVHHRPRRAGVSKYGLSRTPRVLLDLLRLHFPTRSCRRRLTVHGIVHPSSRG